MRLLRTDAINRPVRRAIPPRTMSAFRIGHTDAELLAKEFANTFIPVQFVELDRYQIFIRFFESGIAATPFPAKTLPGLDNCHLRRQNLIQRSPQRLAAPRAGIDATLKPWRKCNPCP